jgi:hypothetical protein
MGILSTFWWVIWKERNGRVFEGKEVPAHGLAIQIQDLICFNLSAWRSSQD